MNSFDKSNKKHIIENLLVTTSRPNSAWSDEDANSHSKRNSKKQAKESWNLLKRLKRNKKNHSKATTEGEIIDLQITKQWKANNAILTNSWLVVNPDNKRRKSKSFSEGLNTYGEDENQANLSDSNEEIIIYPVVNAIPNNQTDTENTTDIRITILSSSESDDTESTPQKTPKSKHHKLKPKRKPKDQTSNGEIIYFKAGKTLHSDENSDDHIEGIPWQPKSFKISTQHSINSACINQLSIWQMINLLSNPQLNQMITLIDLRNYSAYEQSNHRIILSQHISDFPSLMEESPSEILIFISNKTETDQLNPYLVPNESDIVKLYYIYDYIELQEKASYILLNSHHHFWLPVSVFNYGDILFSENYELVKTGLNQLTDSIDLIITSSTNQIEIASILQRGVKVIAITDKKDRYRDEIIMLFKQMVNIKILLIFNNLENDLGLFVLLSYLMLKFHWTRGCAMKCVQYVRLCKQVNLKSYYLDILKSLEKYVFGKKYESEYQSEWSTDDYFGFKNENVLKLFSKLEI